MVVNKKFALSIMLSGFFLLGYGNNLVKADEVSNTEIYDETYVTGEIFGSGNEEDYNVEIEQVNSNIYSNEDGTISEIQNYEVTFELPAEEPKDNDEIIAFKPFKKAAENFQEYVSPNAYAVVRSSSEVSGGIKANLSVDYSKNSTGYVRINRVYGSWVPTSGLYYTTDRGVRYGINYQGSSPTVRPGTSFNIIPSDKNYRASGVGLSGATSWATGRVYGMNGAHEIEVSVRF